MTVTTTSGRPTTVQATTALDSGTRAAPRATSTATLAVDAAWISTQVAMCLMC